MVMEGRRSKRSSSKLSNSQLSSSRSGDCKQSGSLHSSSQLRLRGSRSILGSYSSLASLSKRNLASDSSRLQKPEAQICDEHGEDVTPRPLLHSDLCKKASNNPFWNENASSESIFQHSGPSGGSLTQPFSASVIEGGSVTEGSMSMFGSSLGHTREEPAKAEGVSERGGICEGVEMGEGVEVRENGGDPITITLSETETIDLLSIPGTVVLDLGQQETVRGSNQTYQELLKNRQGNDRYSERGMQTINNARKTKHVQTDPVQTTESGVSLSSADIYDTYLEINSAKDSGEDATLEELSTKAASRLAGTSIHPAPVPTALGTISHTAMPGESTFIASVFTQSGSGALLIKHPSGGGLPNQATTVDPTQPNNHPILKAAGLPERLRAVERAVMMNFMQNKQALYRNMPPLLEHTISTMDSFTITKGHLQRLWDYSCPLTQRRSVTAIAWNPTNHDIVAVGYGGFSDKDAVQGVVCCWSLKNPEYPDRVFHATSGVTSLSFSHIHPNLLAAGLYNGTVILYNIRSTEHSPVLDSRDAVHQHCGPVWQVMWVLREKSLGEDVWSEALVSTSTDGRILQWSIRKGLESSLLMKLKRFVLPKPAQTKKQVKGKQKQAVQAAPGSDAMISQHAPGLGFDFNPSDPNIYLACTEEGLIHKCSCSYNEQVLQTYKGHTDAVYHVRWSPFVSDVFVSCSADWSVKLWHHEHTTPLHSFSNGKTPIYDVVWSPYHSAMFGCVSDGNVEVWNLDASMMDPVIHQSPSSLPTCLSFSYNTQALLVGVATGEVGVYQLKNVTHTADKLKNVTHTADKEVLLSIVDTALDELQS